MPRLSSPRLSHGRRHIHLSHLNITHNPCVLSCFVIISSSNFSNCSSVTDPALVFAEYLRSDLSVYQLKALRCKARGYLSELRTLRCVIPLCHPTKFLAFATNPFSSTATGSDKVAYFMLKHYPHYFSALDGLL